MKQEITINVTPGREITREQATDLGREIGRRMQFQMHRCHVPGQGDCKITPPADYPTFKVCDDKFASALESGKAQRDAEDARWHIGKYAPENQAAAAKVSAMRMTPDNGYLGYQVFDADGTAVSHVAWVDDTKQELACFEWPYRIVGNELAMVIKQVNGVRVDHVNKAIHINTGVTLTLQSKARGQVGHTQPKACTECRQEATCRRISYCAQYRCCFGEASPP